jgi:hypothetical protein
MDSAQRAKSKRSTMKKDLRYSVRGHPFMTEWRLETLKECEEIE